MNTGSRWSYSHDDAVTGSGTGAAGLSSAGISSTHNYTLPDIIPIIISFCHPQGIHRADDVSHLLKGLGLLFNKNE